MSDLHAAALRCALQGWPVFPCGARAKTPLCDNGFKDATTDTAQLDEWWTRWPRANIGFVPGRARLIVIDIDGPEGERAAQTLGLLSEPTFIVRTPRPGQHLYFKHPGGHIGNVDVAPGIDVRADAGYVLLPPSVHPNGGRYTVQLRTPALELPPAAAAAIQRVSTVDIPRTPLARPIDAGTPRRRAYVAAAIEDECLELAKLAPDCKRRNIKLNEAAFKLARFVETGEADPGALADVLTIAAKHAGLREREIQCTIESAFTSRGVGV
jgi:hypothetical protein